MNKLIRLLVITGVLAGMSFAQNAALAPIGITFLDANGNTLAGGFIFSYAAGTSTPIATFTSSSGSTQNSNPVVLDSAGNATIFLLTGTGYKFVIQNSGGITIRTLDGITVTTPSSSGGTQWTTTGNNISNANSGNVGIGCPTPTNKLDVCGTSSGNNYLIRIDDTASSPGINLYGASSTLLGSIAADSSAAFRVRAANGASQFYVAQGQAVLQDQTTSTGTTTLTIGAGPGQGTNHLVSIKNSVNAELAFVDSAGEFASPLFNATGNPSSHIAFQTNTSTFSVDMSGNISFVGSLFGAEGASFPLIDSSQNAHVNNLQVDGTCTGCGGGGGGGSPAGVVGSIQTKASSSTFGGDASLTYAAGTVTLAGTGSFQTTGLSSGFNATLCTAFNCLQAPVGGIYANLFSFLETAAPAAAGAGGANIYADASAHMLKWSENGGSFYTVGVYSGSITTGNCVSFNISGGVTSLVDAGGACTTGGGGGTVASSSVNQCAIYSAATTVTGSAGCTFNPTTGVLTISGGSGPGINTAAVSTTGPIQATTGSGTVSASATAYNTVKTDNGGHSGLSFTAVNYIQTGTYGAALGTGPTMTSGDTPHNGALSWSTAASCLAIYTGSWACLAGAGGGITSLNSQTGPSVTIAGTANEISVAASANTITLSTPQGIGTSSAVNFATVTTTGALNSTATGSSVAYTANGGTFTVNGNGNVGAQLVNSNSYQIGAVTVIDVSKNAFVNNLTVSGTCTGCGGGGGGVSSITGTANEIIASASTGAITLSTSQPIGIASNVAFNSLNAGCGGAGATQYVIQSCAPAGSSVAFQTSNFNFQVDGWGDVSVGGSVNAVGTSGSGLAPYRIGGVTLVDSSRNAFVNNLTIAGTCTGCSSGSVTSITGTANEVIASSSTGAITLSTPQPIGTASSPTFANVTAVSSFGSNNTSSGTCGFQNNNSTFCVSGTGTVTAVNYVASGLYNSTATTTSIAFQTSTSSFSVDGYGDISSAGSINSTGNSSLGLAPYRVSGTAIVDSSRNLLNIANETMTGALTVGATGSAGNISVQNAGVEQASLGFTAGVGGKMVLKNSGGTITASFGATTGFQSTVALEVWTSGFVTRNWQFTSSGLTVNSGSGAQVGATCSGTPTSSFATLFGIVTHC